MKSEKKVKRKQMLATMKFTMKKFQLVRKYANYPTWDEKQNAPYFLWEKYLKQEFLKIKVTKQ